MLQPAIDHLASDQPNSPGGAQRWYLEGDHNHADSLYGSPALVQLHQATGDKRYLEILHAFWDDLCGELVDKRAGLFYPDRRFIGQTTPAGKKILWSRGNGWVMGGLVRVLDHLPPDEPRRAKYVDLLPTTAAAQAQCQGEDGLLAAAASAKHWPGFWQSGGAIDLSASRDPRWRELERRIVLAQYLTAVNSTGSSPPQESGLFSNSWHGKFHLEMTGAAAQGGMTEHLRIGAKMAETRGELLVDGAVRVVAELRKDKGGTYETAASP